jgi:hypothetical protein
VNLKRFRYEYDHSEFIECDRGLAIANRDATYRQDMKKNGLMLSGMIDITSYLASIYKHYWFAGGTLIGWYRDCGIIPHTTDVDFAIWSREYTTDIRAHFLGNNVTRLAIELGMQNDSYELRLSSHGYTFDLFLVYGLNETHDSCGYQVQWRKYM